MASFTASVTPFVGWRALTQTVWIGARDFRSLFLWAFLLSGVSCSPDDAAARPNGYIGSDRVAPSQVGEQSAAFRREEVLELLRTTMRNLDTASLASDREYYDPSAVAKRVGPDPDNLLVWIRDETVMVPYRGVLRGPLGVLADRMGNSLDRSLLLYTLLQLSGHEARLVRGSLSQPRALTVRRAALASFRVAATEGAPGLEELLKRFKRSASDGVSRVTLDSMSAVVKTQYDFVARTAGSRAADQAAELTGLVRGAMRIADETSAQAEALREHWWVQVKRKDNWFDLDPTPGVTEDVRTMTPIEERLQPANLKDMGDSRLHTLTMRLVLESLRNGRREEKTVTIDEVLPATLVGESLVLEIVPASIPGDWRKVVASLPTDSLRTLLGSQTSWRPELHIGGRTVSNFTFDDRGEVSGTGGMSLSTAAVSQLGSQIGDMLRGRRVSAPDTNEASLTAVWLEFESRRPGRTPSVKRRELIDLIGPSRRAVGPISLPTPTPEQRLQRNLALLGETEILPLVGHPSQALMRYLSITSLLANRAAVEAALGGGPTSNTTATASAPTRLFPGAAFSLALARSVWSPSRTSTYLDQLNILSFRTQLRVAGAGVAVQRSFDIVDNQIAVRADAPTPWRVRFLQGVLDTNLEAYLAGSWRPAGNTSDLFALRGQAQPGWVLVRSESDLGLASLNLPDDIRQRLKSEIAGGGIVVAPTRAVRIADRDVMAWWRIDPANGNTLGMGSNGWGVASLQEYTLIQKTSASLTFAGAFACLVGGSRAEGKGGNTAQRAKLGLCMLGVPYCFEVLISTLLTAMPIAPLVVAMCGLGTWGGMIGNLFG